MITLTLVTAPATEPVTLAEAKAHLRVDLADDDTLITTLITVARQHVETVTRRALITQTWELVLDSFAGGDTIAVPLPSLQSVTSITYKDDDGNVSTYAAANYAVDTDSEPGRIRLVDGADWPTDQLWPVSAVRVRFVAGYGDDATDVPAAIRQAMLMLIGHWYENREATSEGVIVRDVPLAIDALLATYRVFRW